MIKRIFALVLFSSIVSAVLLYLGITMMEQYSPALASSLSALVAGTNVKNSRNAVEAQVNVPLALSSGAKRLDVSPPPNSASSNPVDSGLSQAGKILLTFNPV